MAGAGTGAGAEGLRGEMMETKSERMKAKSVTIIPWLVWFVKWNFDGLVGGQCARHVVSRAKA